jgi:hypothetical protein
MIIRTRLPRIVRAAAITIWPFVLVVPGISTPKFLSLMRHERAHLKQQRRWFIYGFGVGLLLWYLLYLFALPVGFNPWRYKWEADALRAQGYERDGEIRWMLQGPPWYLWWH